MIRINLLKSLEPQARPIVFDEPSGDRKKLFLILGGLALAVGGVSIFLFPSLLGGKPDSGDKSATVLEAPPPIQEGSPPKRVTSQAVEEVVRDIGEDQESRIAALSYADLVPSEKIEFQYFSSTRILKDIKAVTPPAVGFANFIFTPPGDFYVHGLAGADRDLERFKVGLSGLEGALIKPGLNAPAGARGQSREFSFFGSVKYPLSSISPPHDRVLSRDRLQAELDRMKAVAGALGISLNEPRLVSTAKAGDYKRMVYKTGANCSYQQIQDLLGGLHEGKSNLGFIKIALRARGDEKVVAELDVLAYVIP
jgi:hypothetical protein